ncbi:MAG TPA: hypothetical protein VM221_09350 [Armatimonadota bacterium]|nr:hypothetical protein [Armatimonadota bacterium]
MSGHLCWKCGKVMVYARDVGLCWHCGATRSGGLREGGKRKTHHKARPIVQFAAAGRGHWSGPDLADQLEYMREHQP